MPQQSKAKKAQAAREIELYARGIEEGKKQAKEKILKALGLIDEQGYRVCEHCEHRAREND